MAHKDLRAEVQNRYKQGDKIFRGGHSAKNLAMDGMPMGRMVD